MAMRWIWRTWSARFVLFAVAFAAVLVPRLAIRPAVLWSIALGIAMAIASGSLRQWGIARRNRRLVEHAPGLVERRDGQRVAVCGTIESQGETLRSPIYDEECVAYQYTMYHQVYSGSRVTTSAARKASYKRVVDYAGFGAVPATIQGPYFKTPLGRFPILHDFGEQQTGLGGTLQELRDQPPVGVSLRDVPALAREIGEPENQRVQSRLENASRYLSSATFDPMPKGEMIEWIKIMDKNWDGTLPLAKNFRRDQSEPLDPGDKGEPYDPKKCDFWEQRVAPGAQVCVLGTWSDRERALVSTPDQDLELYAGTSREVAKTVGAAVGCTWFFAVLLAVASAATTIYLVQPRFFVSP